LRSVAACRWRSPHDPTPQLRQGFAWRLQGHAPASGARRRLRTGTPVAGTGEDARITDQRLRVLPRHAFQGRARRGETEQRLYLLDAWRESPFYSERERAALAWTEALTRIAKTKDVPDALYDEVRKQFSDKELVDLSLAIIAINGGNRLAIPFRSELGHYQPGDHAKRK